MYGLGSRGGTPGGRLGGAFPVHPQQKHWKTHLNKQIKKKQAK